MQMEVFFSSKKTHLASVYGDCNEKTVTLLSHLTWLPWIRMNDFTCWKWFVYVYSSRHSVWTDAIFHRTACSVHLASFGTFVSRTLLPYTAYRCTVFFQQFSDSFVWLSNERMKKCKSVNLLFFSQCLCCSNRKRVQLNMFSLSSLISRIRKSVVWCCLQYPISFSPFN